MDLEEPPDSRERTGAPVLWLSFANQVDVWELFCDNSYLSAILDRQGLQVAVPVNLRNMKMEHFSPQLLQGFWSKLKVKPRLLRCPRLLLPKFQTKGSHMATRPFMLGRSSASNPRRKTLSSLGTRIKKDVVAEKGYMTFRKGTTANGHSCEARNPSGFVHTSGNLLKPT